MWKHGCTEDLAQPIKTVEDKCKMVLFFLAVKGLVKQQIDSFNFLINQDIKNIVLSNEKIVSPAV